MICAFSSQSSLSKLPSNKLSNVDGILQSVVLPQSALDVASLLVKLQAQKIHSRTSPCNVSSTRDNS